MDGQGQQQYGTETYAGDRADQTNRGQRNMPQEDRSSRSELEAYHANSQAGRLAPHVRMGDDRVIGSPPNWESMTSTELHNAATQRNSPETADNLGRAFNEGGNRLADAANRLLGAIDKLDAAWSGNAADAARGALRPLASSAGQAGQTAQLMGAQMARQTAAASEVRKLPPPKEFDHQSELQAALANPNPVAGMADMKAKKDAADAVKREQVAYLNAYTQTMSAVDSQTPSFIEPPPSTSGGDGGRSNITGGAVDYRGPRGGFPQQGTSTGAPSGPAVIGRPDGSGQPGFLDPNGDGEDLTALPSLGGGPTTGTSGYAPPTTTTPHLPGGPGGLGGPHTGAPGAGAGGFGNAFGSFGGGGASGAPGRGPGSGAAPARGPVPGGAPGAGESVAGRPGAAAGAAGRAGAPGAGGMGGGRGAGRKEEDDEHQRPAYLVEGDPEGTFGSDELTAPPVIGQE